MQAEADTSRIIRPRADEGEPLSTSLRIPKKILERLDAVAKASNWTRTEVILEFLRWALEEHEEEEKKGKKG